MQITNISCSAVALAALLTVGTGCANDTFKQLQNDLLAGVKAGACMYAVQNAGQLACNALQQKDFITPATNADLKPVITTVAGVCALKLSGNVIQPFSKDEGLRSNVTQAGAIFGTAWALHKLAVYFGIAK